MAVVGPAPIIGTLFQIKNRLARIASSAILNNPVDLPAYGSGPSAGLTVPTITQDTTAAVGLTTISLLSAASGVVGPKVAMYGGLPIVYSSAPIKVGSYATSTNLNVALGSRPAGNFTESNPFIVGLNGEYRPSGVYGDIDTYGMTLDMLTDADKIALRIIPTTTGQAAYYRVMVDGQYISKTPTLLVATNGYLNLTFGARLGWHRITFEIGCPVVSLLVSPLTTFAVPDQREALRAVFVTDSYGIPTGTAAADSYFKGWTDLAGLRMGWRDNRHVSIGGTGFLAQGAANAYSTYRQRVADVVWHNPDVLILQGSINDVLLGGATAPALQAEVLATIGAYRAALPFVPIVVTGNPAATTGPSATAISFENAIAAAVAASGDSNVLFVPVTNDTGGPWFYGAGNVSAPSGLGNTDIYIASDGLHAPQVGHDMMSQRFTNTVRAWLLQ